MNISVIGDSDTVAGFRLAGITNIYEVSDPSEADSKIKEISQDENAAIIIVTEKIAEASKSTIDDINLKKKGVTPMIIEVPDKSGKIVREVDPLNALIRRAIGIELK